MRVIPAIDAAIELAVLHSEMSPHLPLPFKPIFFAPVDGWSLVVGGLVQGHGGSQAISPGCLDDGSAIWSKADIAERGLQRRTSLGSGCLDKDGPFYSNRIAFCVALAGCSNISWRRARMNRAIHGELASPPVEMRLCAGISERGGSRRRARLNVARPFAITCPNWLPTTIKPAPWSATTTLLIAS
jgi:hypothetical protein